MATLPLQSWRMAASLGDRGRLGRRRQAEDGDRSRLGTAVEADAASAAIVSRVMRRMDTVCIQIGQQCKTLGRAGIYTQPAAFALIFIDSDVSSWLRCHNHLAATGSFACGRCNHFVFSQYW